MSLFVTGGAGFIGSNFVRDWLARTNEPLINLDLLTYAGNLENLADVENHPHYTFVQGDIGDHERVVQLLAEHQPRAIVNFAAESHVDRSILAPANFIDTNVVGTFRLLDAARGFWRSPDNRSGDGFRFLHVSTDEVYGSLKPDEQAFSETHCYAPNNPYSASKAAADHLVRAYHHTYGLPVLTTNCSNNYGPYQFPEKLIPLVIHHVLCGQKVSIYGDGQQIRDWLYVGDHCRAIVAVLEAGRPGQVYNIGGRNEKTNLEVAYTLCDILEELNPPASRTTYRELITLIADRPGHDRRYAISCDKIEKELGWTPDETFATGIRKTVIWYLEHQDWVSHATSGAYRDWIGQQYASRESPV